MDNNKPTSPNETSSVEFETQPGHTGGPGSTNPMQELLRQSEEVNIEELVNKLVRARVNELVDNEVLLDFGYKADGIVPLAEFPERPTVGDEFDVVVQKPAGNDGPIRLSHKQAVERIGWQSIKEASDNSYPLEGTILKQTPKGFTVSMEGREVFLPATHVGYREDNSKGPLVGRSFAFKIIDIKEKTGSVVVSRKALQDERNEQKWREFVDKHQEGEIVRGTVKKFVVFGVFVEVDGVLGLLHNSDLSWKKGVSPKKEFKAGEEIDVRILAIDSENNRLSLGRKQLTEDPWLVAERELKVGDKIRGRVRSLAKYGAFMELAEPEGLEGLIHKSEMSWTKKINNPAEVLKKGEEIEAVILDIDFENRKLSLGYRQAQPNPWDTIKDEVKPGDVRKGKVTSLTSFGAFVRVTDDIDGLIHVSDLSWDENVTKPEKYVKKGQEVEYKVLAIDTEKQRVSLGLKHLQENPYDALKRKYQRGALIRGTITNITPFGLFIRFDEKFEGLAHKSTLPERLDSEEQMKEKYQVGQEVGAVVLRIEPARKKISLSVKDYNRAQEKQQIKQYLGDGTPAKYNAFGDLAQQLKGEDSGN